jgi:hypothetical protein
MREATASLPCYVWNAPGNRISVSLSLEVVDDLGLAVMEGFQALPRRGLEVGGFLLGRVNKSSDGVVVEIDRFEPLDCEHAVGPSYLLSPADRKALEGSLRSRKSSDPASVVGFYRSDTRKEFALTMEDTALMADYFSKPSALFLLIHMQRGGPPMAAFHVWDGRNVVSPNLPFPFRRAILATGDYELCDRASVLPHSAGQSAVPTPAPEKVPPPRPTPQISRPAETVVPIRAAPIRVEPIHEVPRNDAPISELLPKPAASRPVGLLSARLSRFLLDTVPQRGLRWVVAFSVVLGAILAGALQRTLVQKNTLPPAPVADSRPSAPATVPIQTAAAVPAAPTPNLDKVSPFPEKVQHVRPPEPAPASRESRSTKPAAPAPLRTAALETRAPAVSHPTDSPVLPDAPVISSAPPTVGSLLAEHQVLKSLEPRISEPAVTVTIGPPAKPNSGLLSKLPLIGKRSKHPDFVPPAPVREEPPVLPADLRRSISEDVAIEVKVHVDSDGKVTLAESVSNVTPSNRNLATLAVFSARRWEFRPAHLGDKPVPGEVILQYRFTPEYRLKTPASPIESAGR